jgi:hypothetical protein
VLSFHLLMNNYCSCRCWWRVAVGEMAVGGIFSGWGRKCGCGLGGQSLTVRAGPAFFWHWSRADAGAGGVDMIWRALRRWRARLCGGGSVGSFSRTVLDTAVAAERRSGFGLIWGRIAMLHPNRICRR